MKEDVINASLIGLSHKIYPRAVSGVFARWRWSMVWLTQIIYYGLPWLPWPLTGDTQRQAVLFDLAQRKFHIFGLILHPQDFIYLTALLFIAALSLFLFTAIAGRLWCGYACPQTVYTEIFMWIERKIEGERGRRIKLDKAKWSLSKVRTKGLKHLAWALIAIWTGITFVGYFTPIKELLSQILNFSLSPWQTFWVFFYSFATWGNAGFMREQVCKYMCPYARFQGVMVDSDTFVITYDPHRGEPRKPRSRSADRETLKVGDCIDCGLCVQVCPTGIDIRDGQQYECIGCAACIDACNNVMDKVGYPRGLIRYDSLSNMHSGDSEANKSLATRARLLRPRVIIYSVLLIVICVALFTHILSRTPLSFDVMRDRGTLSRVLNNGEIENIFQLLITNSTEQDQTYRISIEGIKGIRIDSNDLVHVSSADNRKIGVRVNAPSEELVMGSNPISFSLQSTNDPAIKQTEESVFFKTR